MSLTNRTTDTENAWLIDRYQRLAQSVNGLKSSRFAALRTAGFEEFVRTGFPTPKDERWKYTNLRPIAGLKFAEAGAELAEDLKVEIDKLMIPAAGAFNCIFVDGVFQPALSTLDVATQGVSISTIAQVISEHGADFNTLDRYIGQCAGVAAEPLVSLNSALMEDGLFVHVSRDIELDRPVHLIHLSTSQRGAIASFPRSLIIAEAGAKVSVIETFAGIGEGPYLTNPVTEIFADQKANVEHFKVGIETDQAFHTGKIAVQQADSSLVSSFVLTLSGKLIRNEIDFNLSGSFSDSKLLGLSVLDDEQHVDNHTVINHAQPSCESFELYKGVYGGKSKGAFCGTIIVEQAAQKTNAIQNNQTLLLSDEAQSFSRPQLKIWADDVKCTHGATIGQLDDDALFYLKSRGIGKVQAKKMLVSAFAHEVVHEVQDEVMQAYLDQLLDQKLDSFDSKVCIRV